MMTYGDPRWRSWVLPEDSSRPFVRRALEVGFAGARIERTACGRFRVVVTGIPDDPAVQDEFQRETRSVGLDVSYAPAMRYAEVPAGIAPVPP